MVFYLFCFFLLQLLFGAVLTETDMYAFSGMCFPLFSNLTSHELMTLYMNGNKDQEMVAIWEVKNAAFTCKALNPKYKGKIFLGIEETLVILICNLDQTHSAKYIVQYGINKTGPEVKLTIIENKQLDVCLNSPPNLTENYFDGWNPLQIVTCIIVTIILLMQNWNQLREGLINMKDWILKKRCGQHMPENEPQNEENESFMEVSGNFTGEQIREIRKLLDDHTEHIKEYLGNFTGEQIREIRKLLDDHTKHIKEYLDEIKAKIPKLSKEIESLPPERNGRDIENEDDFHPLVPGRKEIRIRETDGAP